jgi:TRAP-type transport system periplasmic protein
MTTHITRRRLLAGTGVALAAPAIIRRRALAATTLTLGHGAAPGNPRSVAAEEFAKLVEQKTNGNVTVNIAGSEQLGNDVAMLTSLRTGALDITANSQGAVSALVPELATIGLPFLFEDSAAAFRVLDGPVGAKLGEKFTAVGMMPLGWWDNGIRHTTNSKRPINTPADLQGLTIRTPADPMTIDIFQALGASTEQIAFSELYVALQQGVVDGQENPLANIATSKLYEVNKYISLTGHKWESNPFLISQIAWARVGKDGEAVMAAAKEATEVQRRLAQEAAVKHLAEFKANPDLEVNEVDRAAFQAATAPVVEKWKAEYSDFVTELLSAVKA